MYYCRDEVDRSGVNSPCFVYSAFEIIHLGEDVVLMRYGRCRFQACPVSVPRHACRHPRRARRAGRRLKNRRGAGGFGCRRGGTCCAREAHRFSADGTWPRSAPPPKVGTKAPRAFGSSSRTEQGSAATAGVPGGGYRCRAGSDSAPRHPYRNRRRRRRGRRTR